MKFQKRQRKERRKKIRRASVAGLELKTSEPSINKWKKVGSEARGDFRIFTIRADQVVSPRTGKEHEVFVLDSVNWVNVIAVTPKDELVMVEQYRHGSDTVELEIPGGMMDSADSSPEMTGARELKEETGYVGGKAKLIGEIFPNPAIMSNRCFTVLIQNCRSVDKVKFDDGEDLVTRLVPVAKIPDLVAAGKIQHSLVVVGLYYYELYRRKQGKQRELKS